MKRKILVICAVCAALGAVIFSQTQPSDSAQSAPPAVVSQNAAENAYCLSFTATRWLNEEDPVAMVCTYDLQSGAVSEHFRFPVSAMYALGIYDQASNAVFYSKELDNDTYERWHTGDQIYRHDLTTGADEALTDDLLAVNYLHPIDDALLFLAATLENPDSLVVGRIDLPSGEIRYWDEVDTASTRLLSLDRERERLYVAMYDADEDTAFFSTDGV